MHVNPLTMCNGRYLIQCTRNGELVIDFFLLRRTVTKMSMFSIRDSIPLLAKVTAETKRVVLKRQ